MSDKILRAPVGSELLEWISERLNLRQPCVVMAPAYGGKSFVARTVARKFAEGPQNLFHFEFEPGLGLASDDQVMRCLRKFPASIQKPDSLNSFHSELDAFAEHGDNVVVLNHLDGLSRELAGRLLRVAFGNCTWPISEVYSGPPHLLSFRTGVSSLTFI